MNLLDNIKQIVNDYVEIHYNDYLKENNILKIKDEQIKNIITDVYEKNTREFKQHVRTKLKTIYQTDYPSASVENILLDMFQDKDIGIDKLVNEITIMQEKNTLSINLPVVNNSININIEFQDSFIVIKNIDPDKHSKDIYNQLSQYRYLYSINQYILEEYTKNEKIEIIKKCTKNSDTVTIECYILK